MTDTERHDELPGSAVSGAPADGPADHVDAGSARSGDRGVADGAAPPHPASPPAPPPPADRPAPGEYTTGGVRLAMLIGGTVLVTALFGWPVLAMILGVVVMIFLHELGHYATAKWSGMKVTEFFIGFGPRIWSFRRGETEYGVKAVPAGAYVRIIGMNNLDEVDPADEPRTYREQSFPKRLLVVSAGSLMHLLQAFVLAVVLLGVVGVPGGSLVPVNAPGWDVGELVEDSAAVDAGVAVGDRIVAVDGRPASDFGSLGDALADRDVGDPVAFTVERDGETVTLDATLGARPADQGGDVGSPFLGVSTSLYYPDEPMSVPEAVVRAPGQMVEFTGMSLAALGDLFSPDGLGDFADNVGSASSDRNDQGAPAPGASEGGGGGSENRLISIVGFINIGAAATESGWAAVLFLFFQVNIFIGLINMMPLPPLDGGHAAVAIYERIRSRGGTRYHVDMTKLLPLTYAVVLALLTIGGAALYLDVVNPIPT